MRFDMMQCELASSTRGSAGLRLRFADRSRHDSRGDFGCRRVVRPLAALAGAALVAAAALALPAAASAGNGIGSLPATQALDEAAAALKVAPNIVMHGKSTGGGQAVSFTIKSVQQGKEGSGTLVSSSASLGFVGTLHFVLEPTTDYLWGGSGFWKAVLASQKLTPTEETALLKVVANTWIQVPSSQATSFTSSFADLANPGKLSSDLSSHTGTPTAGKTEKVEGVEALAINVKGSSVFGFGSGDVVWVSTVGAPLPLEVDAAGLPTGDHGKVTLQFPPKLEIIKPLHAKTLAQIEQAIA